MTGTGSYRAARARPPTAGGVMPWNADETAHSSVRRAVELVSMPFREHMADRENPQELRHDLQESRSLSVRRRRAIVALSLVGMAGMAVVSLFQVGLVRHLPDPPVRRFHSDKVNSSYTAYRYGVPDGALSLAAHAMNIVMAAIGGRSRARRSPWIPLLAAGKAGAEAAVAAKYLFYRMPVVERSWCGYCIVDALARIGTFVLTLPEAAQAVSGRFTPQSFRRRFL